MAKISLIFNEHPQEVVAGHHARLVAKALKEKYGDEVFIAKIPVEETAFGIVCRALKNEFSDDETRHKVRFRPTSMALAERHARNGGFVFNFHSSNFLTMAKERLAYSWRKRSGKPRSKNDPAEYYPIRRPLLARLVEFEKSKSNPRVFVLELPERLVPLKPAFRSKLKSLKTGDKLVDEDFHDDYGFYSPLWKQGLFASSEIAEAIAKHIHEEIVSSAV